MASRSPPTRTITRRIATFPLALNLSLPDAGDLQHTMSCASYPFGDGQSCTGSGADATEHHFTGKERDSETGLDYFGARYYGSGMGRFMAADPAGVAFSRQSVPQSWNLYSYVLNAPTGFIDPDGHECVWSDGSFDSADDKQTGTYAGCDKAGGVYYEHDTFTAGGGRDWSSQGNADLAKGYADTLAARDALGGTPGFDQSQWSNVSTSGRSTMINFGGAYWQTTQFRYGNHAWRDNNPGNVESGGFTSSQGAIGADGRFAVFPSSGMGSDALDSLLHTSAYINLSVDDAVARYAPGFENNTAGYQQFLHNAVGVGGNTPLSSLSPAQFGALERGISAYEGFSARGGFAVTTTTTIAHP